MTRKTRKPVTECFEIWISGDEIEYRRDGITLTSGASLLLNAEGVFTALIGLCPGSNKKRRHRQVAPFSLKRLLTTPSTC